MRVSLVLTVIGADRPGIVARLSKLAGACNASWQESKMARVAGQFAGVVRLDVPADAYDALERSLRALETEGLQVTIGQEPAAGAAQGHTRIALDLVGHDRDGIVRDISSVVARHGVSIDELETGVEEASMSGEQLFHAQASLLLPAGADLEALRTDLEEIADELMVDLHLDDGQAAAS